MNESDLSDMGEKELVRIIRRALYELTRGKQFDYEFEINNGTDSTGIRYVNIDVYRSRQKIY